MPASVRVKGWPLMTPRLSESAELGNPRLVIEAFRVLHPTFTGVAPMRIEGSGLNFAEQTSRP